jgi:hypothetical protein
MAQAVKLAIISGGIRHLEFADQMRVVKALQIIEGIPDKYDEIKDSKEKLKPFEKRENFHE